MGNAVFPHGEYLILESPVSRVVLVFFIILEGRLVFIDDIFKWDDAGDAVRPQYPSSVALSPGRERTFSYRQR
jgi:hypothetical protein